MDENLKPSRRWFRFSLRTMLVLVTLVAIEAWLWRALLWPPFPSWLPGGIFVWIFICVMFSGMLIALCFSVLAWLKTPATNSPATQD